MSLFKRDDQPRERSAADRERARLEREARRAAREGRPVPPQLEEPQDIAEPPPVVDEPEPMAEEPAYVTEEQPAEFSPVEAAPFAQERTFDEPEPGEETATGDEEPDVVAEEPEPQPGRGQTLHEASVPDSGAAVEPEEVVA